MEVRFAYDDDALYVGARMSSTAALQAPMGRRDEGDQSEYFGVYLDTYFDRRTAYAFGVTAAGVRLDEYFPNDDDDGDDSFDPVWLARTSRDDQGWTAELWIPFSQLRFTERNPQVWGLNVKRWVPSLNEEVHWQLLGRTEQRLASRFGDLHGIDGIQPRRRIELLPYVASSSHLIGLRDERDPFTGGANMAGRVGLDAKIGIGSNLTLEATVNPDFGQVEADPAEVNLSAFETFFTERRPFFVEGSNLLQGPVNNFFYSRRIGEEPPGDADGDFVDVPAQSTIVGAAKLTGRLESGLSIGMLGALTGQESARTFTFPNIFDRVRVAPRTTYGVTGCSRSSAPRLDGSHDGERHAPRSAAERPDRLAGHAQRLHVSGDSLLRLGSGDYEIESYAGYSRVDGDAGAIDRVQRASARYLQRPDADYVQYDPLRTTLSGGKFGATLERRNAQHWLWSVGTDIESPEFETNDVGRLNQGDGVVGQGTLQYRETRPGRFLRDYNLSLDTRNEWNFGGDRQQAQFEPAARLTWLNFWETEINAAFNGAGAEPASDARRTAHADAAQLAGRRGGLEQRSRRHARAGDAQLRRRRRRRTRVRPRSRVDDAAGAAVAAVHRAAVPAGSGHATVRHRARRGQHRYVRQPLRVLAHRPFDVLDAGADELYVQTGPDARLLRRAVRGERTLRATLASCSRRAPATFGSMARTGPRSPRSRTARGG